MGEENESKERERTPSQVKEHRVETIQGEGGGRGDASPPNTPPLPLTHRITHIHACSATLRGRGTSPLEKIKHKRRREYQHGRAAKASRTGERTHARTHTHRRRSTPACAHVSSREVDSFFPAHRPSSRRDGERDDRDTERACVRFLLVIWRCSYFPSRVWSLTRGISPVIEDTRDSRWRQKFVESSRGFNHPVVMQ